MQFKLRRKEGGKEKGSEKRRREGGHTLMRVTPIPKINSKERRTAKGRAARMDSHRAAILLRPALWIFLKKKVTGIMDKTQN